MKKSELIDQVEKTGKFPKAGHSDIEVDRRQVKKYLEYKFGHRCAICGISEWNGKEITLIVDHIDGNHANLNADNYRLICPNCDSQLETFKSKNKNPLHNRLCHTYSKNNWSGKGYVYFHKDGKRKRFDPLDETKLLADGWIRGWKL